MTVETVSNAEIARRVDDVRAGLAEDIDQIRRSLEAASAAALPRELYVARHDALVHRVSLLEVNLARVEAEHRAAMEKLEQERRAEIAAQVAEQRQTRRFLWSAGILPLVTLAVTIYQGFQGPA